MNKEELIRAVSQETSRIIPQDKIHLVLNKTVEIICGAGFCRLQVAGNYHLWTVVNRYSLM